MTFAKEVEKLDFLVQNRQLNWTKYLLADGNDYYVVVTAAGYDLRLYVRPLELEFQLAICKSSKQPYTDDCWLAFLHSADEAICRAHNEAIKFLNMHHAGDNAKIDSLISSARRCCKCNHNAALVYTYDQKKTAEPYVQFVCSESATCHRRGAKSHLSKTKSGLFVEAAEHALHKWNDQNTVLKSFGLSKKEAEIFIATHTARSLCEPLLEKPFKSNSEIELSIESEYAGTVRVDYKPQAKDENGKLIQEPRHLGYMLLQHHFGNHKEDDWYITLEFRTSRYHITKPEFRDKECTAWTLPREEGLTRKWLHWFVDQIRRFNNDQVLLAQRAMAKQIIHEIPQ